MDALSAYQSAPIGVSLYTVTPCRLLDTRDPAGTWGGPSLSSGSDRTFPITGRCNIPPGAKAIAVNVAVTQPTAGPGFLTLYPGGTPLPSVSTINYRAGQTRAGNAIVKLGASGDLTVRCTQGIGTADMVLDVSGYLQ